MVKTSCHFQAKQVQTVNGFSGPDPNPNTHSRPAKLERTRSAPLPSVAGVTKSLETPVDVKDEVFRHSK